MPERDGNEWPLVTESTADRPLRVLILAPKPFHPANTGARIRNLNLSRQLARNCELTFLSFADSGEQSVAADDEEFKVLSVPGPGRYTPGNLLKGIFGKLPVTVLKYTTSRMERVLEQLLDREDFDIVQIESIHLFGYLPVIRRARSRPVIICDWHNVESELMFRYGSLAGNPARRLYALATARKIAGVECEALQLIDAHVAVSQRDRESLLKIIPSAKIFVVENGVDLDAYSDSQIESASSRAEAQASHISAFASGWQPGDVGLDFGVATNARRNRLVFVASMDYVANQDAAIRFANEVWPRLHSEHPELVFTIVGRNPNTAIRALESIEGIEVTGTVDDVRPYYREALAAVVPLRMGGGSRLKILEAMAAGVPVVSTPLGAEGLDVTDGENIAIASSEQDFTCWIIDLAGDRETWNRLSLAGRGLVESKYGWRELGKLLASIHAEIAQEYCLMRANPVADSSPVFETVPGLPIDGLTGDSALPAR